MSELWPFSSKSKSANRWKKWIEMKDYDSEAIARKKVRWLTRPEGLRPDFLTCLALRCSHCNKIVYHSQTFVVVRLVAVNHHKKDTPLRMDELRLASSMLTEKPWTMQEIERSCNDALCSGLITKTIDGRFYMDDSQFERYLESAGKCSECGGYVYELQQT